MHEIPNANLLQRMGPPYNSAEFADYMKQNGIKHHRPTLLWPQRQCRGQSFMKPLMNAVCIAHVEGRNWQHELHKFLLNYRSKPHTTSIAPPELLYGRVTRGRLPHLEHDINSQEVCNKALARDAEAKCRMKLYANKRRHVQPSNIQVEDRVLVKQTKANELTTQYEI